MHKLIVLGALAPLLWLVAAPSGSGRSIDCQPVRAVFYTSSDWLRLAQGLAANPSPCAQYFITIPALAADKTQMRPNAAVQVRALGPNLHAAAEINYTAWQNWVAATGSSWYAAGQEARRRMAATGFDISAGDTWALNEVSSAVRNGTGTARQNVRDLVRGLYEGDGSVAQAKGIVFDVGVGQNGLSFPVYKASYESWLQDSGFWTDMTSYVSDFFQEAYGDVRNYAVAGAAPLTRIGLLNAYLQHPFQLVTAPTAPAAAATARAFLSSTYGPLANASWAWGSSYGWTQVGSDVMADYISAQTYAMRFYAGTGRIGFAWNPLNSGGLAAADFDAQVAGILARLAGSISETDGGDPSQACEATGCSAVVDGAAAVTGWAAFSSWTPTVAAFSTPPVATSIGTVAGPLTVQLQTGGVATTLPNPSTVTLSSSSHTGTFSTGPSGPWSPTLTLTIPSGTGNANFYTLDPTPGSTMLTANLNGQLSTQTATIGGAAPTQTTTTTAPPAAQVTAPTFTPLNGHMHVDARLVDAAAQPLQGTVALTLVVGSATVASTSATAAVDGSFGLTAQPLLERGCYSLRVTSVSVLGHLWNGVSPDETYCVQSLPAHVGPVSLGIVRGRLHAELAIVDDAGGPVRARVSFAVDLGSAAFSSTHGLTSAAGRLGLTAGARLQRGCYSIRVTSVNAAGYTWDHGSPVKSYCVQWLSAHITSAPLTKLRGRLHLDIGVADAAGRPLQAHVSLAVIRGAAVFAAAQGRTSARGRLKLTVRPKLEPGCYRVRIKSLTAAGFRWDHAPTAGTLCTH